MLNPFIESMIDDSVYIYLLKNAAETNDFAPLEQRLALAIHDDPWMQPFTGESGTKYYKPFVQSVVPKVINSIRQALANGTCPEIEIMADEIYEKARELGFTNFGSPQDVLYGFTSERYMNWGTTLNAMHFVSACMVGQAKMLITMAPRYLKPDSPCLIIDELEGAITQDFWESSEMALGDLCFKEKLEDLLKYIDKSEYDFDLETPDQNTPFSILSLLHSKSMDVNISPVIQLKSRQLIPEIEEVCNVSNIAQRIRKIRSTLKCSSRRVSQEQIALKYVEEGKFLQKLLGGLRVEHIQSNVKMVKNPLRGYSCEADSIYRVVGEKTIVLIEAKDKPVISTTQLYQMYETFRLRLPLDWKILVVAIMRSQPAPDSGISSIIDLIDVSFQDDYFGGRTESLASITARKHYRWNIRKQ